MRLPRLFRTTPFRLTLLFLALFAAAASAFLAYIYLATAGEATRRTDQNITREMHSLVAAYDRAGVDAVNQSLIERAASERPFLYLLMKPDGTRISGSIAESPIEDTAGRGSTRASFSVTDYDSQGRLVKHPARGIQEHLSGGEILFVGADISEDQAYVVKIVRALWGAGALVIVLGLAGGLLVSRNVSRSMGALNDVVAAVRNGDFDARAAVRGARDEFDELSEGINEMLDRLQRSMSGHRHAGDAIAHDLRSPLTRLRARLETAYLDVEAGKGDAQEALAQALEDTDGVLKTFGAVLAIARLQAAGQAPDQNLFDPTDLAADLAELYEPTCEDKGLEFGAELAKNLQVRGNREFLAQALANLLDNAIKYTPAGGAIMLRVRRRSSGEIEFSVTDTGPGVPDEDRARVVERFVRLENSRSEPGSGLGLSLVAAVAEAHGGRLELSEGPGKVGEMGPGLRVALILPRAV
ncbi:histidine kinase [Phenylobacterium sp. Root77]|jgi:signal transduction histidine kinase|uniref:sensor histidine kinase n=1 Tax=unclassified Phenylobacterium TaxID=2640670 RepID=UPI0006FAC3C1|nr:MULTISPECIES: HAMP domain-containing sensor histidine kinase [unclassified Phenylobacterium]KQW72879.1 histidine kinase [Phenylobacterium sp. Root1277]KQW92097.1 histidine kinase [Phenylobacterium sp. Root1290]KRC40328.1 histidine kinase [Phenylobacterium sp. Root77]